MEWCCDPRVPGARRALEEELAAYFARRVEDATARATALGRAASAIAGAGLNGPHWVGVAWDGDVAELRLRPLGASEGSLPGTRVAAGVTAGAGEDVGRARGTPDGYRRVSLDVTRRAETSIDPDPGDLHLPADRDGFLAGMAVLTTRATGYSAEARAALAGAAAARRAEAHAATGGGHSGWSAARIAEAFVAFQQRVGGDFAVVEESDDRVVLANRTCPFGAAVEGAPQLCRVTSAMLGSLAARCSGGDAAVTLDERIALGDHRCRLTLQLGRGPRPAAAHRYTDPPTGVAPVIDLTATDRGIEHGISLSLQLPRDRVSVPVIRHLTRHALSEVGVTEEVTGDIELALTEACTNVLEHAGPGDAYEVSVAVRAERCELRVVDTGHGFDHQSVRGATPGLEAERGRGLSLMHLLMDRVDLASEPARGTLVTLIKRLSFDESSPARRLLAEAVRRGDGAPSS